MGAIVPTLGFAASLLQRGKYRRALWGVLIAAHEIVRLFQFGLGVAAVRCQPFERGEGVAAAEPFDELPIRPRIAILGPIAPRDGVKLDGIFLRP